MERAWLAAAMVVSFGCYFGADDRDTGPARAEGSTAALDASGGPEGTSGTTGTSSTSPDEHGQTSHEAEDTTGESEGDDLAPLCHGVAPGHVGLQRLTTTQLRYTLEELLGIPVALPDGYPRDDRSGGYTSVPEAQLVSQSLVEQHLDWTLTLAAEAVGSASPEVITCELGAAGCAETILGELAYRAFRRPVLAEELEHVHAIHAAAPGDAKAKLELAIAAILNAPQFLFRERQTHDPRGPTPLTGYDVATRLSYFLWETMPDEALLSAAASGALADPVRLEGEVHRMLADPRSERLARAMASQWLGLSQLSDHGPSVAVFPELDEELKGAMLTETVLFLHRLVREDRPVSELLTATESFVNGRLAEVYGLRGSFTDEFVLTDLTSAEGGARPGVLGQLGPLTMTSSGETTSIIRRGKWVSTALLCVEIPPPPPVLDTELPDDLPEDATPREVVEIHRADPACAVCHRYLDPPGVLLEVYDPIGRSRTHYPPPIDRPIETDTLLMDGTAVRDIAEFASLASTDEHLVECVTDRLFPLAVGRMLGSDDRELVASIAQGANPAEITWTELLVNIVRSEGFRCDAGEEAP